MIHPTPTERSQRAEAAMLLAHLCSRLTPTARAAVARVVAVCPTKTLSTIGGVLARLRGANLTNGPSIEAIAAAVRAPDANPASILAASAGLLSPVARRLAFLTLEQRGAVAELLLSDAPAHAGQALAHVARLSADPEVLAAAIAAGGDGVERAAMTTGSKS